VHGLNHAASSRRRALVFVLSFVPATVAGLGFVYTRPPEYRAAARVQINPAATVVPAAEAKNAPAVATDPQSFLSEVQVLTSRPVIGDTIERMRRDGALPELGPDPVAAAQKMLRAEPVEGTWIVSLSAIGAAREFVPRLVNAVAATYRERVTDAYKKRAANADADVAAEAKALEAKIAAQKTAVNTFRHRYDIVSIEHQESDVLADIQGLSKAYTEADQRLAKAQGRLDALKSGKAVLRAKDDPTLASLQQRASMLREEWREMQGRFTPSYLELDPAAKALRARIDNLEQQLRTQAAFGERAELADAHQEMAAARAAVEQLRGNVAENQKRAQEFATHLNDYKSMREDLDHLEAMHRAALDRLAKLQASEQQRAPNVELLEAAAPATQPWRPDYRLDAALALSGAFAFALVATWFVDFLAGPPRPPLEFGFRAWPSVVLGGEVVTPPLLAAPAVARLPPPEPLPRALTDAELAALLAAAPEDGRLVAVALLTGMQPDEISALEWSDIDNDAGLIRIRGGSARELPLNEPLRALLQARRQALPAASGAVLRASDGGHFGSGEIARLLLFAAYDAGLERPQEVTAEALRYAYIGYLLRQGIRAADIERIVGRLPHTDLATYMQLHSPTARRPIGEIDRLPPSLRDFANRTG
jgi:succinoglycan biosynthesis transport protein ExoP